MKRYHRLLRLLWRTSDARTRETRDETRTGAALLPKLRDEARHRLLPRIEDFVDVTIGRQAGFVTPGKSPDHALAGGLPGMKDNDFGIRRCRDHAGGIDHAPVQRRQSLGFCGVPDIEVDGGRLER